MSKSRFVEIGRIMGAHGVNGGLKVKAHNPRTALLNRLCTVYLKSGDAFVPQQVMEVSPGPRGLRVHLSGVTDRVQAQALFDTPLYVPREEFGELGEGEYYLDDLLGLQVFDRESGELLGRVEGIIETGANDCLDVRDGRREILVPVLEGVVVELSLEEGRVVVQLPEGLLELYEN